LHAYSAPFAVLEVYLNRYGFADKSLRAIKPAYKTGCLAALGRDAFALINYWT
jgi:hypothetical protein